MSSLHTRSSSALAKAILIVLLLIGIAGGRLPAAHAAGDVVEITNVQFSWVIDPCVGVISDGMQYKLTCSWDWAWADLPQCKVQIYRVITFKDANGNAVGDADQMTSLCVDSHPTAETAALTTHDSFNTQAWAKANKPAGSVTATYHYQLHGWIEHSTYSTMGITVNGGDSTFEL